MHYIADTAVMDVTDEVTLGGGFTPSLPGPVPANLAAAALQRHPGNQFPAVVPGHHVPLPPFQTRLTNATQNPANYRTDPAL